MPTPPPTTPPTRYHSFSPVNRWLQLIVAFTVFTWICYALFCMVEIKQWRDQRDYNISPKAQQLRLTTDPVHVMWDDWQVQPVEVWTGDVKHHKILIAATLLKETKGHRREALTVLAKDTLNRQQRMHQLFQLWWRICLGWMVAVTIIFLCFSAAYRIKNWQQRTVSD